jgi:hypothetical protein
MSPEELLKLGRFPEIARVPKHGRDDKRALVVGLNYRSHLDDRTAPKKPEIFFVPRLGAARAGRIIALWHAQPNQRRCELERQDVGGLERLDAHFDPAAG